MYNEPDEIDQLLSTENDNSAKISNANVMIAFLLWITENKSLQNDAVNVFLNWIRVTDLVIKKKLTSEHIFEIIDFIKIEAIYNGIITDSKFRTQNFQEYKDFINIWSYYLDFMKDAKDYLERVNGLSKRDKKRPIFSEFPIRNEPFSTKGKRVDFDQLDLLGQTRPISCSIRGNNIVPEKLNWAKLLVAITEYFIAEKNPNLSVLYRMPLTGSKIFFLYEKDPAGACTLLSNNRWVYTNYNPKGIAGIIKSLCIHCGVNLKDVGIYYLPNTTKL